MSEDLLRTMDWKRGSLLFKLQAFHKPRSSHYWLERSAVFLGKGTEALFDWLGNETEVLIWWEVLVDWSWVETERFICWAGAETVATAVWLESGLLDAERASSLRWGAGSLRESVNDSTESNTLLWRRLFTNIQVPFRRIDFLYIPDWINLHRSCTCSSMNSTFLSSIVKSGFTETPTGKLLQLKGMLWTEAVELSVTNTGLDWGLWQVYLPNWQQSQTQFGVLSISLIIVETLW